MNLPQETQECVLVAPYEDKFGIKTSEVSRYTSYTTYSNIRLGKITVKLIQIDVILSFILVPWYSEETTPLPFY
jgi:hypothetical protein